MKKTTSGMAAAAVAVALLAFGGPASAQGSSGSENNTDRSQSTSGATQTGSSMGSASSTSSSQKDAKSVIDQWPDKTKTAAQALISKYGQPDLVLDKKLAWAEKGQFGLVAVYRDAEQDPTPAAHSAFVTNAVQFRVPDGKVADLQQFDKGIVIDRLHSMLSVSGESEAANTLTLNLAHDIITGKRTVAAAKTFYKDTMMKSVAGKSSPYMDQLQFSPSSSGSSSSGSSVPTMENGSPAGSESTPGSSPSGGSQTSPSGTESTPSGGSPSSSPSGSSPSGSPSGSEQVPSKY